MSSIACGEQRMKKGKQPEPVTKAEAITSLVLMLFVCGGFFIQTHFRSVSRLGLDWPGILLIAPIAYVVFSAISLSTGIRALRQRRYTKTSAITIVLSSVVIIAMFGIVSMIIMQGRSHGRGYRSVAVHMGLNYIATASRQYYVEYQEWPKQLGALTNNPKKLLFMQYRNLSDDGRPLDPWGHPYIYIPYNAEAGCGSVLSRGSDGKPGGKRTAQDIVVTFQNPR